MSRLIPEMIRINNPDGNGAPKSHPSAREAGQRVLKILVLKVRTQSLHIYRVLAEDRYGAPATLSLMQHFRKQFILHSQGKMEKDDRERNVWTEGRCESTRAHSAGPMSTPEVLLLMS